MSNPLKPLSGIRIIDFGRYIAAPYCGMVFADFGADVIRIERPGGEVDRTAGQTLANGENSMFQTLARNKKGFSLDLFRKDNEDATRVLHELLGTADVFLHNFSPTAAAHFNLDYETLKAVKADLIYASISSFGLEGPYANRIGFDQTIQFLAGPASLNGTEDTPPLRSVVPWVDYSTGLYTAIGILTALRHREATGEGQCIDASLMSTTVSFMSSFITEHAMLGTERERIGNRVHFTGPTDLFPCKDGQIYITGMIESMFHTLLKVIGHPELINDPRCKTAESCFENRVEIDSYVSDWTKEHTVEEVSDALEKARLPFGVYRKYTEIADDPHVQQCKLIETVDLEMDGLEAVPVSGIPIKLSRSPGEVRQRPPRVGEHTNELLKSLGYDDNAIQGLREKRII